MEASSFVQGFEFHPRLGDMFRPRNVKEYKTFQNNNNIEWKSMSKVLVRVVGGKCQGEHHKKGDTFEIDYEDPMTPQGMCFGAFGAIFPYIMILIGDGKFRWEETKTKTRIPCADPNGIILEIEKV